MTIKSRFLIHWTGKDIQSDKPNYRTLAKEDRDRYTERLINTCNTGLWMMPNAEHISGLHDMGFHSFSHITCLTENRSDYYLQHAEKYGLLGLGFTREWVLEMHGMPAIYLKNSKSDLQTQLLTSVLLALQQYKDDKGNINEKYYREHSLILDFAKPMSNTDTNDFAYIEEAEWRIAWNSAVPGDKMKKNTLSARPEYYLPFTANELKLIVQPDSECRKMALTNPDFVKFYQSGNCEPLLISLEELLNM